MRYARVAALVAAGFVLAGCGATTEQAEKAMESRFIGHPSDAFFAQYGAPRSSFRLNDGGTVYQWRGGETTINVPAVYKTVEPATPSISSGTSHTTTTVSNPDANTTVVSSRTKSSSFSIGAPTAQQVLVTPAQTIQVFCEAQITADAKGIITHIHASQDTRGAGMNISRCAEVFDVK